MVGLPGRYHGGDHLGQRGQGGTLENGFRAGQNANPQAVQFRPYLAGHDVLFAANREHGPGVLVAHKADFQPAFRLPEGQNFRFRPQDGSALAAIAGQIQLPRQNDGLVPVHCQAGLAVFGVKTEDSVFFAQIGRTHKPSAAQLHRREQVSVPSVLAQQLGAGEVAAQRRRRGTGLGGGKLFAQRVHHGSHQPGLGGFLPQTAVHGDHGNKVVVGGHQRQGLGNIGGPVADAVGHVEIRAAYLIVGADEPGTAQQLPLEEGVDAIGLGNHQRAAALGRQLPHVVELGFQMGEIVVGIGVEGRVNILHIAAAALHVAFARTGDQGHIDA